MIPGVTLVSLEPYYRGSDGPLETEDVGHWAIVAVEVRVIEHTRGTCTFEQSQCFSATGVCSGQNSTVGDARTVLNRKDNCVTCSV